MCQNFGKQEIADTNKMAKLFFFGRLETISIGGFFKSCLTNPIACNFEHDGLFKYL
jgi:hypothetical protein